MKAIQFQLGDTLVSAQIGTRVEKGALYGFSRKAAEKNGVILEKGLLSADGRLLRRSQTSYLKIDPEGSPVEDIIHEIEGKPAEMKPSSFDQPGVLTSVPATKLAAFAVSDVYPIDVPELATGVYETTFSYRRSIQHKEALLIVKPGEAFLLCGSSKQAAFLGLDVAYSFFDEAAGDSEESEDLDFSMV